MAPISVPADRIEQFLSDNPSGRLWVAVGFASAFGFAWLNERTAGRRVDLLVGDIRKGFSNFTEVDRLEAIRFLQRPDVSVRNWYRKRGGYRMAHAKTWIAESESHSGMPGEVLVGSANLTEQGLFHNIEMLAMADRAEHERLFGEMSQIMAESWNIEDRLLQKLGAEPASFGRAVRRRYKQDAPSAIQIRQSCLGRAVKWASLLGIGGVLLLGGLIVLATFLMDSGESSEDSAIDPSLSAPDVEPVEPQAVLPTPQSVAPARPEVERQMATPQSVAPARPEVERQMATPQSVAPARPEVERQMATPTPGLVALTDRPRIETRAPPEGWEPTVGGNASTYGEPERSDLQWIAWQPNCPSCEAGATLSWVGSYAFPYSPDVGRRVDLRPLLRSACLHRERTGPQIDWRKDITGDWVEAMWIDGESVPTGLWWIGDRVGGDFSSLMVPEPEPFLALLAEAKQLRILTAEDRDATFAVGGFLATSVQDNLDYCGHYP